MVFKTFIYGRANFIQKSKDLKKAVIKLNILCCNYHTEMSRTVTEKKIFSNAFILFYSSYLLSQSSRK